MYKSDARLPGLPCKRMSILIFAAFALLVAIPARAAEPTPADTAKTELFMLAHPDDEVMIAARIRADVRAGRTIFVVWATRGDKAGDPDVREMESRAAMAYLGVPDENLHFFGAADAFSFQTIPDVYTEALEIARAIKPDVIFSDAWEGGNIDHDTVHFVAEMISRALPSHPAHYEFPLYNSYKGTYQVAKFIPREGVPTLATPLDTEGVALKQKMLTFYPSQQALFNVMGRLVNKNQLMKRGEPFRRVPNYDYLVPPTEGKLGYELGQNRFPHTFPEFRAAAESFIESPLNPDRKPAEK